MRIHKSLATAVLLATAVGGLALAGPASASPGQPPQRTAMATSGPTHGSGIVTPPGICSRACH